MSVRTNTKCVGRRFLPSVGVGLVNFEVIYKISDSEFDEVEHSFQHVSDLVRHAGHGAELGQQGRIRDVSLLGALVPHRRCSERRGKVGWWCEVMKAMKRRGLRWGLSRGIRSNSKILRYVHSLVKLYDFQNASGLKIEKKVQEIK